MDFVRIELGGYRQEVVIGSLSIPEYQLAISDPESFRRRMDHGEFRYFHECDDIAHYCGIVVNESSEAAVTLMRRDPRGTKDVCTLWEGPAIQLLRNTRVVRPQPCWWVPIDQRRYRGWFTNLEKGAACDFDIKVPSDKFSIDKLSAEITWAYASPVYTKLLYDGQALEEMFISSNGTTAGIHCKVQEMDRRHLLAEEAKLERLGLLKDVRAGSVPDYEKDEPVWVEVFDSNEEMRVALGRPYPVTA
jgi:hypothetical protein